MKLLCEQRDREERSFAIVRCAPIGNAQQESEACRALRFDGANDASRKERDDRVGPSTQCRPQHEPRQLRVAKIRRAPSMVLTHARPAVNDSITLIDEPRIVRQRI
jgi:hypothetical protein